MYALVEWTDEEKVSTITLSRIKEPRKDFCDYKVGDIVKASCHGFPGVHPAKILAIRGSTTDGKKQLEKMAEDYIAEKNQVQTDSVPFFTAPKQQHEPTRSISKSDVPSISTQQWTAAAAFRWSKPFSSTVSSTPWKRSTAFSTKPQLPTAAAISWTEPGHATPATVPPGHATPATVPPERATPATVPPGHTTSATVPSGYATPATVPPGHVTPATVPPGHTTPASVPPTVYKSCTLIQTPMQLHYSPTLDILDSHQIISQIQMTPIKENKEKQPPKKKSATRLSFAECDCCKAALKEKERELEEVKRQLFQAREELEQQKSSNRMQLTTGEWNTQKDGYPRAGRVPKEIAENHSMMELMPGSGIYVYPKDVRALSKKNSGTGMARYLMSVFTPMKSLLCCHKGKRCRVQCQVFDEDEDQFPGQPTEQETDMPFLIATYL
ncbi:hypothetical protein KUTeg_005769 [Tegillarca granosa]|uniref:Uncharacterized protein n=1 Tax=Tegillarca granosa TaxID=220873 RepID=A0ABQ9FHD2_TEGGR|nr:hypothetical protein KUTeg_005769 [Tegillarca granosa]